MNSLLVSSYAYRARTADTSRGDARPRIREEVQRKLSGANFLELHNPIITDYLDPAFGHISSMIVLIQRWRQMLLLGFRANFDHAEVMQSRAHS